LSVQRVFEELHHAGEFHLEPAEGEGGEDYFLSIWKLSERAREGRRYSTASFRAGENFSPSFCDPKVLQYGFGLGFGLGFAFGFSVYLLLDFLLEKISANYSLSLASSSHMKSNRQEAKRLEKWGLQYPPPKPR